MQILTDPRWHEVCNVGQMARLCLPRQLVMVDVAVCFIDTGESNAMKLPGAETSPRPIKVSILTEFAYRVYKAHLWGSGCKSHVFKKRDDMYTFVWKVYVFMTKPSMVYEHTMDGLSKGETF